MKSMRGVAIVASVVSWLYAWQVFRGVRAEYAGGDLGPMPQWLWFLMAAATTLEISVAVVVGLKSRWWPLLAIAGGVGLVVSVIAAEQAILSSAVHVLAGLSSRQVGVPEAIRATFKTKSVAESVFLVSISALLVVAGIAGLLKSARSAARMAAEGLL